MANDVASRREARRRRILENSEHRLQKIAGRGDIISKGNGEVCQVCVAFTVLL
jgi:hypothetical protein